MVKSFFRDCIFVDQKTYLWIWSEYIVSTFALKVAYYIWYGKEPNLTELENKNSNENAFVICKGNEPNAFKALFPFWKVGFFCSLVCAIRGGCKVNKFKFFGLYLILILQVSLIFKYIWQFMFKK